MNKYTLLKKKRHHIQKFTIKKIGDRVRSWRATPSFQHHYGHYSS